MEILLNRCYVIIFNDSCDPEPVGRDIKNNKNNYIVTIYRCDQWRLVVKEEELLNSQIK